MILGMESSLREGVGWGGEESGERRRGEGLVSAGSVAVALMQQLAKRIATSHMHSAHKHEAT